MCLILSANHDESVCTACHGLLQLVTGLQLVAVVSRVVMETIILTSSHFGILIQTSWDVLRTTLI